ncbi:hypothetical protein PoB_007551200 [Plakobranchus ocellatus]|uniref:Uncharacterized protein n=1 Tax=Plakobranchus ocellatus TaxID=259542 RepID=A0AAV4DXG1_9GAST|nr:hypothetical protein PoB_007551200 [Plakobranchus ocellatus]
MQINPSKPAFSTFSFKNPVLKKDLSIRNERESLKKRIISLSTFACGDFVSEITPRMWLIVCENAPRAYRSKQEQTTGHPYCLSTVWGKKESVPHVIIECQEMAIDDLQDELRSP